MAIVSSERRSSGVGDKAQQQAPPKSESQEAPPYAESAHPFAAGTNPNAVFEEKVDGASGLRELEGRLDRCLASLTMHFQPIVHAKTRKRFGYEALLRSTDKSLPHPGAILDAAERLERIPTLGRAVRAATAKVIATAPPERGVVFINLHLLDLFDKQLTSPFAPLSKVASRVVLEITERGALDEVSDVGDRIRSLRNLGFRVAIDDLGAGYAGLTSIAVLEPDYVKLDMTLTREIDRKSTRLNSSH